MSLLSRLKVLWLGFWSSLMHGRESRHHALVAHGVIAAQRQNLRRVREALANLIFQKRKLNEQLLRLNGELAELRVDVEQAARDDRDELAVNLLARLEKTEDARAFADGQLQTVEADIVSAREVESQLAREITQAEQMLGTLSSRYEALQVRRELHTEILNISKAVTGIAGAGASSPIQDQIHRLEAELETMQVKREDWERQWQDMRRERLDARHKETLRRLKDKLRGNVLPALVVESRPVH